MKVLASFPILGLAILALISGSVMQEFEDVDKTVELLPAALLPDSTYTDTTDSPPSAVESSPKPDPGDIAEEPADSECSQKGSFGCPCNTTNICDSSKLLECIDDTCYCMNSLHRMYDYDLGKCVNLVGSPCLPDYEPPCIDNSQCIFGSCKCNMGFSENSNRMCMLNIGQACGPRQCNSERGLACKNGMCECLDSMYTYSILHGSCVNPREMVRKWVNRFGNTAVEEVVDRKFRKVVNTGLNILTLPLRFIPFVG